MAVASVVAVISGAIWLRNFAFLVFVIFWIQGLGILHWLHVEKRLPTIFLVVIYALIPLLSALPGPLVALDSEAGLAIFSGNTTPEGSEPLAQAYAGHQFGGFSPQLGDGRALLLGEVIDTQQRRRDIQLKGSGRTPFSRGGDGKAALGPVLREYLIGEGMHALGIPTTRALASAKRIGPQSAVTMPTARPGVAVTSASAWAGWSLGAVTVTTSAEWT